MIYVKRWTAFLLCLLMALSSQGLTALAETIPSENGWILESEQTERIEGILPLQPLSGEQHVIYWNPGGQLPIELATASNAEATQSDAMLSGAGEDNADGQSPATAVKTFAKAIERAEELMEQEGLLSSDLTIYAINPMEIAEGELYVLNGGNIRIASWPERPYQSDVVFYLNGGQLTLLNTLVESGKTDSDSAEAELIHVHGGILQIGQNVIVSGQIIMDYSDEIEAVEWEVSATSSDAPMAEDGAGDVTFNINDYILSTEEDMIELLEDHISVSTWREPVIELLSDFNGAVEYLLKIWDTEDTDTRELVTTLYADDATAEEFLCYFALAETEAWELQVETQATAEIRDTGLERGTAMRSFSFGEEPLTQKTLIASRADSRSVIYWNPGSEMVLDGIEIPAGDDGLYDGSSARAPLKTWTEAVVRAKNAGGKVAAMQSLDLGRADAGQYLTQLPTGEFYLSSGDASLIIPLGTFKSTAQPAILVPEGQILITENIFFGGMYDDSGNETENQTILVNEGDLIVRKNVRTEEKGYIQLNAFSDLAKHPIQVCSIDSTHDGDLRVFFGGINKNIAYRWVDVVVPGGDLEASIASDADPGRRAEQVGEALESRMELHPSNRSVEYGGLSDIDWSLRQDTAEDDGIERLQNIELHAAYYFSAVFIDGVNGDDRNYGASCDYPVKTWERAKSIWEHEMEKSLKARKAALTSGFDPAEIEEIFPLPETIYICGTITVDVAGEPEWFLSPHYDQVRNEDVTTEIRSHIDDLAGGTAGHGWQHELPKTLIKVVGNGVLSIRDIMIRNMLDDTDSVTIAVEDGGCVTLKGTTVLTGACVKSTNLEAKDFTLGNHVIVTSGGTFVMDETWIGSIEKQEQGIVASGVGTTVEMNNGLIRDNNSYRSDLFDAGFTNHKTGTGVVLSEGARFTMNGGKITGNTAYQYGAGVYLTDHETTFIMNKGEISNNIISGIHTYNHKLSGSDRLLVMGVGVFADTGTTVQLGNGVGSQEETIITGNRGNHTYGAGIYSDGVITINNAVISQNVAGGDIKDFSSRGIGVYLDTNAVLTMEKGLIDENYGHHGSIDESGNIYFGNTFGAGIYINTNENSHLIKESTISNNYPGDEYNIDVVSYSRGGGIYLSPGNVLTVTDSYIIKNSAAAGGGIYASTTDPALPITLTLKGTQILENETKNRRDILVGDGGGIYYAEYGSLILENGTKIADNYAVQSGGGIYLKDSGTSHARLHMIGTAAGAIEITGNEARDGSGGGIYHAGGTISTEHVLFHKNRAKAFGGAIYAADGNASAYIRNIEISENRAGDGAGINLYSGAYYMQDCIIADNVATGIGGGVHLSGTGAELYLSESEEGRFGLKDNHANNGGGIGLTHASVFKMDIAGPIQNRADEQGSNFYLSGYANDGIEIWNGEFRQPAEAMQKEGVYNIYLNDMSTNPSHRYVDFSKVAVERKAGANPDVIFLNSGSSFLTVLASPPDHATYGTFPIDLNKDAFTSGSIVLKPHGSVAAHQMKKPDDSLSAADTVYRSYSLVDASINLDHYRGGQLPRRSSLGGFQDTVNAGRTNVIIIGQGVYLAGYKSNGTGGDDSNGGTSPTDAVATFEQAKRILEQRIEQAAGDDALRPETEREGYAPFIYICGQVEINGDDTWELDYKDILFTEKNENYAKAEIRHQETVYEAQIRRFASFVQQPMIKVNSGGKVVNFTLGRLIIDGMADSVVLADQGSNSPVIYGSGGTHVTLTGDSMIQNNYYSALDIYGELTLTGEEGQANRQLYNNQVVAYVRLYRSAKMSMLKEARIIADNKADKVASMNSDGIAVLDSDVSIFMSGNSAIIQEAGSDLLNAYGLQSSNPNTLVVMSDNARVQFDNNATTAIYVSGSNAKIEMSGNASVIVGEYVTLNRAIYIGSGTLIMSDHAGVAALQYSVLNQCVFLHDSTLLMSDDASIIGTQYSRINYMVYANNSTLLMSGHASMVYGGERASTYYGIYVTSSTLAGSITMKDSSSITFADTTTGINPYYGVYTYAATALKLDMQNNASIKGISGIPMSSGVYIHSIKKEFVLNMNMETDGKVDESAHISDATNGVQIESAGERESLVIQLSMGKQAEISDNSSGIHILGGTAERSNIDILMKDNSKMARQSTAGIELHRINNIPINIDLQDYAAIEQGRIGIWEDETSENISNRASKLNIEMSGNSRISGHSQYGIKLANIHAHYSVGDGEYQKIIMNDNAVIGGSSFYDNADPASGNRYSGIYTTSPIQITMNDHSRVSGNGTNPDNGNQTGGIYLTRQTNAEGYRAGTAKVILNDYASVCNNKGGGINAVSITAAAYSNPVEIELNGIQEDGTMSIPSISGNTDAVFVGSAATLKLRGGAQVEIGSAPYESSVYTARAIDVYGFLEIDGRSSVDGLIYLNNSENPITMTYAATGAGPKYDLYLAEGFAGQIVVRPDMIGITDLTGAGSQRVYFNKAGADGIAADRPMIEMTPNLMLLGENNIYLSGTGNDNYNGNTPSTAVRTFARARALLEGAGYYTAGANIIICNSTVNILADDTDWSFGTDGMVRNSQSGNNWRPIIIRHENYKGILIAVYSSTDAAYADEVIFKNITIDGGSESGIILTSTRDDYLLLINQGCRAKLNEGAVLQNNKAISDSYSGESTMGVMVYGGTLEIDGGTIRNMIREASLTSSSLYLSSAISVCGISTTYPANLRMKSGQIVDNELNTPNAYSSNTRAGIIYIGNNYSYMELAGGLIERNRIVSMAAYPAAAGVITNNEGNVTISGGIIRENEGGLGSAILHRSTTQASRLIFSGGQITQNKTNVPGQQPIDQYSPIYVHQNGFELYGGGADISDGIYLNDTRGAIKISDHINQPGRSYRIYLKQGISANDFKKGSVVVEPDGNKITDVSAYLPYFDVRTSPYVLDRGRTANPAGNVAGVKEEQCLLLMKAVFLDWEKGRDTNTGLKPSQAVQSFNRAKSIGALSSDGGTEHYVIYISGKARNTAGESVWTLPETAYMCRYTGFPVYENSGTGVVEQERAYYGPLIEPADHLTFKDITVVGRRSQDSNQSNGDSLVYVPAGIDVTVENGAVFADNYNMGNYPAEDGKTDNLSSKGGAFQIAEGAALTINGGTIRGNSAAYGNAVYLHASETNPNSLGHLYLSGKPVISGNVYLDGSADTTAVFVQPDAGYQPSLALHISVANDYNGRPLVQYRDGTKPGETEREYYIFDDAIQALYDIVNNSLDASILELAIRKVLYLDGQYGADDGDHDGRTPQKAFKTLKRTFEEIGNHSNTNGVLVYVVDTVEIGSGTSEPADVELMNVKVYNPDGTTHYEGFYKGGGNTVNIWGQVFFKRYSQPTGYEPGNPVYDGYSNETLYNTLFHVGEGGVLTLNGIYVDGHAVSSHNKIDQTLVAPGVVAQSPLVTVEKSGILKCNRAVGQDNSVATATLFTNNINGNNKDAEEYMIGRLNDSDIMAGSSAGIELLDGGTSILQYTEFSNLALGSNVVSGGTDVYSNGFLHFSLHTNFSGSVFLEGLGTKNDDQSHSSSRYLTVDLFGTPLKNNFQVLMRDPYMGRDVVHYPELTRPNMNDAAFFLLEERVKDYFCLDVRSGYSHILELHVPAAVYIDGQKGVDDQGDRIAGSTPASPVKSLHRAFELLDTRGGNTIYVVGAIQVSSDIQVTGMSYTGAEGTILLGSTNKVNIIRYIQPDFAWDPNLSGPMVEGYWEYQVPDYTGVLLNVQDGATAQFGQNVYFDGHSQPKTSIDLPVGAIVGRSGKAKAPLITVERGGTLKLLSGATLYHNNNIYGPEPGKEGLHGGAIYNSGTTTVDGTRFENNKAVKGAVVYQNGIFTIVSEPEHLAGHPNGFYLTTVNTGTEAEPVWGTDHVIQIAVAIPNGQVFEVDMDHGVKGRDVVRFTNSLAYSPNADAEHVHFGLGSSVPEHLFLVEAEVDPNVLELQNWEILKVEVPTDIYLVMRRKASYDSSNKLLGVISDSLAGTDLFTAPEYQIKNKGLYDAEISITGFENQSVEVGIALEEDLMQLAMNAADATSESDLYLAVKGLDDTTQGSGFGFAETSLQPYAEAAVTEAPLVLGTIRPQTAGKFTFIGAAGSGFMNRYMDAGFPIEGASKEEVQQYMDGTAISGQINAKAKYLMKYKVELDPSRRIQ